MSVLPLSAPVLRAPAARRTSAPPPARPSLRRSVPCRRPLRLAACVNGNEPVPPPSMSPATPAERRRLLLAALKPPIYAVAVVPVLVGFAAAFYDAGVCAPAALARHAGAACAVVAWLNLSNDAWDAETSVDVAKAESVVRLLGGNARLVHALAAAALLLGGGGLAALSSGGGDPRVGALLAAAVACGVLYQAPPFRLSYQGLGEPLCFISFGPLATTAFYLAACAAGGQAPAAPSAAAAAAALLVGATTTAILFCSHFHQIATDAAAGKRSPIVRLGTANAAAVLADGIACTYGAAAGAFCTAGLPLSVAVAMLGALPAALALRAFVALHHGAPTVVFRAKFLAARWHALTGLALTAGFAAPRVAAAGLRLVGML